MLRHESWKISWFANSGMSAVWELQNIKKNMMSLATFGPKSFAQLRNVCFFFTLATLLNGLFRLGQVFDEFYFDSTWSFFLFCHLKDKFDHFFTWLVIHLATLWTNLFIIAFGHFFHLNSDSLDHWLHSVIYSLGYFRDKFILIAFSHFLHFASIFTWPAFVLAAISCLIIALCLHFHLANHCTWTFSLGTLLLLDQNILLAKFRPT